MNLLLIGCGRLGRLFLELWVSNSEIKEIWVVQPSLSEAVNFQSHSKVHFVKNVSQVPEDFLPQVIVIAIKPQQIPSALEDYRLYRSHAIFVSLAAGVSIASLKLYLGEQAVVARVMPNIAIKAHASVNLAYIPDHLPGGTISQVEAVCKGSGHFMPLKEERLLDQLTVISGCGPAYFFLLMETLAQNAARQCGADQETAAAIVRQTFIGSALLLQHDSRANPENLRYQVTSKAGVTEAAIEALQEHLGAGMEKAIEKGLKRIREIAL